MARFAISGNHLYAVDNTKLNIFDISNPGQPQKQGEMPLSFGVETIFPYGDHLFIGTMSGMYILGIQNPAAPSHVAYYQHVVSCDPVVTDGRYAYVTLSSGTTCMRAVNRLEIVDLQNLANPFLLTEYPMTNPKGLGIDGTNLFVCDDGLKLYDATDVMNLQQKQHFNINAYDVIPDNGHLLVIGADGFYQYQYQNNSLSLLSKIPVQRPL
ncbi:MAG TPA: hypothetical protein VK927_03950 [Adhaeribacter sp.]|nr:hypothetical protein [Adhaeribacter sp.]